MTHEDHATTPPLPPGPPAPPQPQGAQQWTGAPTGGQLPPQQSGAPAPGPQQHGAPSPAWDQRGPGGQGAFGGGPAGPGGPAGGPGGPGAWGQQPAKASPGASRTILAASITGVVGLALGAGIGFLVWGGDDEPSSASSASPESTEEPESAETTDSTDEPSDDPSDEPSTDPSQDVETIPPTAPSGRTGEGSSDAPLAFGDTVTTDEWSVTLGAPEDSTDAVMAANQFNSPPAEGSAFFTLPVTATYLGDDTGVAWIDLTVAFVGADGVPVLDSCGVLPDDLMDIGDLATGEVAEGNACVAVPLDADGQWTLTAGWTEEPVYFAAP